MPHHSSPKSVQCEGLLGMHLLPPPEFFFNLSSVTSPDSSTNGTRITLTKYLHGCRCTNIIGRIKHGACTCITVILYTQCHADVCIAVHC